MGAEDSTRTQPFRPTHIVATGMNNFVELPEKKKRGKGGRGGPRHSPQHVLIPGHSWRPEKTVRNGRAARNARHLRFQPRSILGPEPRAALHRIPSPLFLGGSHVRAVIYFCLAGRRVVCSGGAAYLPFFFFFPQPPLPSFPIPFPTPSPPSSAP